MRRRTVLTTVPAVVMLALCGCTPSISATYTSTAMPMDGSSAGANAVTDTGEPTVHKVSSESITDLPQGWRSYTYHDRTNHSWTLIVGPDGAAVTIPTLDAGGNQIVVMQE